MRCWILLALCGVGCRPPAVTATDSSSVHRERPAPGVPAPTPELPTCPEPMRAASPLAALLGGALRPGSWHPDSEGSTLGFAGGWQERGRVRARAGGHRLELVSAFTPAIAAVVLFRHDADGVCVINAWTAYFPGNVHDVTLAAVEEHRGRVVVLVRLTLDAEPPTWLVLATDGLTAWFALQERGAYQLAVPRLSLARQGDRLYLDITQRRTTRLTLRENGRFERARP